MALLGRFLVPEIEARNLHDIWFQQDGATCHTARETMDLLRSRFSEQFISRLGPVDWPPRYIDIYTKKKILLNQKHFFPKACILLIHKNILQIPINMLLIL